KCLFRFVRQVNGAESPDAGNVDASNGSGLLLSLIDGQGSVCGDQLLLAHFVPEVIRDCLFQSGLVFGDAGGLTGPWNNRRSGRMRKRESQWRSLDRDAVSVADVFDALHFGEDLRRCWGVFEAGPPDQNSRAVRASYDHVYFFRFTGRHQALQRPRMIKQRVAARDQQGSRTDVGHLNGEFTRFDTVGAQSPGLNDALFAQLLQCAKRTLAGGFELGHPFVTVEVSRHVMNPDEIEAVDTEPL